MTPPLRTLAGLAASLLACSTAIADPPILTVGPGCAYADLQPAVDASPASGGVIHLTTNLTNQHVRIQDKFIAIAGGFAQCADAQPTLPTTIVSAGSHTDDSVFTIYGNSSVVLRNLTIADAKETDGGYGGGIDYVGNGALGLDNVIVKNNRAGYGGGINMSPDGATDLDLYNHTTISDNTGAISGGGIRIEGPTRLRILDDTVVIVGNVALGPNDGHGGGLQVIGPARADIGSARILTNRARYGGGISAEATADGFGVVRLFRTGDAFPATIGGNVATRTGGGIFLAANDHDGVGLLCGFGYDIVDNAAAEGAAIYADTDSSTITSFDYGPIVSLTQQASDSTACGPEPIVALGGKDCPIDAPCNRIDRNVAQEADGTPTDGATVLIQSLAMFAIERVEIAANHGGYALRNFSTVEGGAHSLLGSVVHDNVFTHGVLHTEEDGQLTVRTSTIAGNVVADRSSVIATNGDLVLADSLVWQPGLPVLAPGADTLTVSNVIAHDVSSLGGGRPDVVAVDDPKFRNPQQQNYRLTPSSPALDFSSSPQPSLGSVDFDRRERVVALVRPDTPLDVGAYELQTLAQFPPAETFDDVVAPAIPDGWGSVRTGGGTRFFTSTAHVTSAPNAIFTDDPATVSEKRLISPEFTVVSHGRVTFQQRVELADGDGVQLMIAVGHDVFSYTDIVAAGGHVVSTPYNASTHGNGNPLGSIPVWSGDSNGFQTVVVDLPPAVDGQPVKLQWHVGTDAGGGSGGYWVDDIEVELDRRVTDRLLCDGFDATSCG